MIVSNCLNCQVRSIGCHATCENYKRYKEEMELINRKRDEIAEGNRAYRDVMVKRAKRNDIIYRGGK